MKKHIELVNYTCYGMGMDVPEELLAHATASDIKAIGIADYHSVKSYLQLQTAHEKYSKIKPIYGVIFLIKENKNREPYEQIFLAKDQKGISQIYQLIEIEKKGLLYEGQIKTADIDHLICGMSLCWADKAVRQFLDGAWKKQHFVLVNQYFDYHTGWEDVLKLCHNQNILPCASNLPDLKLTDKLPPEMQFESNIEIDGQAISEYIRIFGKEIAERILYDYPLSIANRIQNDIFPLPKGKMLNVCRSQADALKNLCENKMHDLYGWSVPKEIEKRLNQELSYIQKTNSAKEYLLAKSVYEMLNQIHFLMLPKEIGNAAFVAFLLGISQINPLSAHYRCKGHYFEWCEAYGSAPDLPEKECPVCHYQLTADGYNIPFHTHFEKKIKLTFDVSQEAWDFISRQESVRIDDTDFDFISCVRLETLSQNDIQKAVLENDIGLDAKKLKNVRKHLIHQPYSRVAVPKDIFIPKIKARNQTVCCFDELDMEFFPQISLTPCNAVGLYEYLARSVMTDSDFSEFSFDFFPINTSEILTMFRNTDLIYPALCDCDTAVRGIPYFSSVNIQKRLDLCQANTFLDLVNIYASAWQNQSFWDGYIEPLVGRGELKISDIPLTLQKLYLYLTEHDMPDETAYEISKSIQKGLYTERQKNEILKMVSSYTLSPSVIEVITHTTNMPSLFLCAERSRQALITAGYKKYYPRQFYALCVLQAEFAEANQNSNAESADELLKLIREAISRGISFL